MAPNIIFELLFILGAVQNEPARGRVEAQNLHRAGAALVRLDPVRALRLD